MGNEHCEFVAHVAYACMAVGRPTCTPVAEGTPVLNSRMTVDTTVSVS